MAETALDPQETLYPLEFMVAGVPISLGASSRSKERWRACVGEAARERIRETDELGFLDSRPVGLTIYYFPAARMEGDIDNIVKPIMDALIGVAYLNDRDVERVIVQKFEPDAPWGFASPGGRLSAALSAEPPLVYVRVDDDLAWRNL